MSLLPTTIYFLLLLGHCSALAQSADTVCTRVEVAYLADSTAIQYEIGSFGLSQSGSLRFLRFVDTAGNCPSNFFRTESFMRSTKDTISFGRYLSFYKAVVSTELNFKDSSDMIDSVRTWYAHHISDIPRPKIEVFGPRSSILYIVEMRRSADDSVIQRLDSVLCFSDSNGRLWAQHLSRSYNQRNDIQLNGSTNAKCYFSVKIEVQLPSPGIARFEYRDITAGYSSRNRYDIYTPYEIGLPRSALHEFPKELPKEGLIIRTY